MFLMWSPPISLNAKYFPSGEMAAVLIGTSLEFAVSCLILGTEAGWLRSRMPSAMIMTMLSATAVPKRSLNGSLLTIPFALVLWRNAEHRFTDCSIVCAGYRRLGAGAAGAVQCYSR